MRIKNGVEIIATAIGKTWPTIDHTLPFMTLVVMPAVGDTGVV